MTDLDTSLIEVNQLMTADELEKCEVVIESGKQVFIEVGNALRDIRDRKGYRHKYGTFEEYCKQRWGFSVSGAYKQIKASEAAQLIQQNVDTCPQIDYGKARTVATLTPPQQVAFAETHDISEMTSREVEKAVKEYKQKLSDAETRVSNLADQLTDSEEENELLREENKKLEQSLKQQIQDLEVKIKSESGEKLESLKAELEEAQEKIALLTKENLRSIKRQKARESITRFLSDTGAYMAQIEMNIRKSLDDPEVQTEVDYVVQILEKYTDTFKSLIIKGEIIDVSSEQIQVDKQQLCN